MTKKILMTLLAAVLLTSPAFAVPTLQVFVAGGTYDTETETWVVSSSTFDLYIISANEALSDVIVSMALNLPETSDPNGSVSVDVNGDTYNSWTYGTPYLLPPHDIYPAWYSEFNAGDFGLVGGVGNTNDGEFYDPSTMGYLANSSTLGEYKRFSIALTGADFSHFDAYFYFQNQQQKTRIKFAPFSHDSETHGVVPEPGTLTLMGLGGLGMGLARRLRKK
ncbi:MAG: PEP-CTERM sorting domain-containing protein [bacterium]|jgi:hypothetical protein